MSSYTQWKKLVGQSGFLARFSTRSRKWGNIPTVGLSGSRGLAVEGHDLKPAKVSELNATAPQPFGEHDPTKTLHLRFQGLISRLKLPPLPDSEKDHQQQQQQQKQKAPSAVVNPRGEAAAEAERFLEVAVTAEQRAAAKDVFLCGADGASALPQLEHPM